jgi:phosphoribosylaminoimidazolecarboxamide formyltransferase/IMP cyclohydrolase
LSKYRCIVWHRYLRERLQDRFYRAVKEYRVRALVSVWEKHGLAEFARNLVAIGWELYSTGRTRAALEEAGVPVRSVSELTDFPEILDGRVKTLHPGVHAGILARRDDPAHMAQLAEHGLLPIDLVFSNLYPFVETIASAPLPAGALAGDAPEGGPALPPEVAAALEQIDVGGPAMIRAAAKNFPHVLVVTDPQQYEPVLEALRDGGPGAVPRSLRARLAQEAYAHTARYDAYVCQYLAAVNGETFPAAEALPLTRVRSLSYGENPHQQAALYRLGEPRLAGPGLADLKQVSGGEPSYNNLLDLDNAYAIVADFEEPAVAIVKHNNPCGVGVAPTLEEAYRKAFAGDPVSAFGGVVAANRPVDEAMARAMSGTLFWVLVAPAIEAEALRRFGRRRTRVFELPLPKRTAGLLPGFGLHYRPVAGGFLAQTPDSVPISDVTFTVVSKRPPTEAGTATSASPGG